MVGILITSPSANPNSDRRRQADANDPLNLFDQQRSQRRRPRSAPMSSSSSTKHITVQAPLPAAQLKPTEQQSSKPTKYGSMKNLYRSVVNDPNDAPDAGLKPSTSPLVEKDPKISMRGGLLALQAFNRLKRDIVPSKKLHGETLLPSASGLTEKEQSFLIGCFDAVVRATRKVTSGEPQSIAVIHNSWQLNQLLNDAGLILPPEMRNEMFETFELDPEESSGPTVNSSTSSSSKLPAKKRTSVFGELFMQKKEPQSFSRTNSSANVLGSTSYGSFSIHNRPSSAGPRRSGRVSTQPKRQLTCGAFLEVAAKLKLQVRRGCELKAVQQALVRGDIRHPPENFETELLKQQVAHRMKRRRRRRLLSKLPPDSKQYEEKLFSHRLKALQKELQKQKQKHSEEPMMRKSSSLTMTGSRPTFVSSAVACKSVESLSDSDLENETIGGVDSMFSSSDSSDSLWSTDEACVQDAATAIVSRLHTRLKRWGPIGVAKLFCSGVSGCGIGEQVAMLDAGVFRSFLPSSAKSGTQKFSTVNDSAHSDTVDEQKDPWESFYDFSAVVADEMDCFDALPPEEDAKEQTQLLNSLLRRIFRSQSEIDEMSQSFDPLNKSKAFAVAGDVATHRALPMSVPAWAIEGELAKLGLSPQPGLLESKFSFLLPCAQINPPPVAAAARKPSADIFSSLSGQSPALSPKATFSGPAAASVPMIVPLNTSPNMLAEARLLTPETCHQIQTALLFHPIDETLSPMESRQLVQKGTYLLTQYPHVTAELLSRYLHSAQRGADVRTPSVASELDLDPEDLPNAMPTEPLLESIQFEQSLFTSGSVPDDTQENSRRPSAGQNGQPQESQNEGDDEDNGEKPLDSSKVTTRDNSDDGLAPRNVTGEKDSSPATPRSEPDAVGKEAGDKQSPKHSPESHTSAKFQSAPTECDQKTIVTNIEEGTIGSRSRKSFGTASRSHGGMSFDRKGRRRDTQLIQTFAEKLRRVSSPATEQRTKKLEKIGEPSIMNYHRFKFSPQLQSKPRGTPVFVHVLAPHSRIVKSFVDTSDFVPSLMPLPLTLSKLHTSTKDEQQNLLHSPLVVSPLTAQSSSQRAENAIVTTSLSPLSASSMLGRTFLSALGEPQQQPKTKLDSPTSDESDVSRFLRLEKEAKDQKIETTRLMEAQNIDGEPSADVQQRRARPLSAPKGGRSKSPHRIDRPAFEAVVDQAISKLKNDERLQQGKGTPESPVTPISRGLGTQQCLRFEDDSDFAVSRELPAEEVAVGDKRFEDQQSSKLKNRIKSAQRTDSMVSLHATTFKLQQTMCSNLASGKPSGLYRRPKSTKPPVDPNVINFNTCNDQRLFSRVLQPTPHPDGMPRISVRHFQDIVAAARKLQSEMWD